VCSSMLCLAALALGVDAGWQPLADGGLEYIIQIPPHALERLKQGEAVASDIPVTLRGVRSCRIVVGSRELPRESLPELAVGSLEMPDDSPQPHAAGPLLDPFRLPGHRGADRATTAGADSLTGPLLPMQSPSDRPPAGQTPRPLSPDPATRPLEGQRAAFLEQQPGEPPKPQVTLAGNEPKATAADVEKVPPLAWTLTVGALIAAVGGMLYLGWVAWDYRARYRALLERMIERGYQPLGSDPNGPAVSF